MARLRLPALPSTRSGAIVRGAALGIGLGVAAYAATVGWSWLRFGAAGTRRSEGSALDAFLPRFDVSEHHEVEVRAGREQVFAAVERLDLLESGTIRGLIRTREWVSGAHPERGVEPQPFLRWMLALGWGVLAETPGREVVMGAVTQPWFADVRFRALPGEEFAEFGEPDYVKIAWSIRVEDAGPSRARVVTKTRAVATDPQARRKFRRYWALVSPGVVLLRLAALRLIRSKAERACPVRMERPR
jgi:hypothetical protein